jgi:predicted secreted protein
MNRSAIGLLLLLAASSLVLVGVAGMSLFGPQTFSAGDNGKNVTVNVGDTFWLQLPENPTAGYSWDLKLSDGLAKLSDKYEPADRSGLNVGVGGTHSYEIKATKKGPQLLTAGYWQAGNQSTGALETYSLNVNVTEGGPLSGLFRLPAMIAGQGNAQPVLSPLKLSGSLKGLAMPEFPIMQTGTSEPPLPAAVKDPPQDIRVTHKDVPPRETINANVGDTIHLSLPENPSTGYTWQMTASDGLEPAGDNYVQGNTGTPGRLIVGAGVTHEWTYKVTKPGTQTITGVYKRLWEGSSEGEKYYTLTINAA